MTGFASKRIMRNDQKAKFIVADVEVSESLGVPHIVVLADIAYWNAHYDELVEWCQVNGCEPQGMTVNVPNPETMTLFALRWS